MNTKLILVILRGGGCDKLVNHLLNANYRVTEFSTMGGFFRRKSTTLLIGVAEDQVEPVLSIVRQMCPTPSSADEHSATVFVLNTNQFTSI